MTPRNAHACPDARAHVVASTVAWEQFRRELLGSDSMALLHAHIHNVKTAPLWWVDADTVNLIDVSSATVPGDTTLTPEMMVEPSGLAFFEHRIERQIPGETAEGWYFDAFAWTQLAVIRRGHGMPDVEQQAVLFCLLTEIGGEWRTVGESWWPLYDAVAAPLSEDLTPAQHETHLQDRSLAAALWLISSQKGLTSSTFERLDRPATRRAERRKLPTTPVRVLRLRHHDTGHERSPGGGVEWSHRWIVRGHWRQQAHGPERQYRRPVWIAPYVKGPEDKPLDTREGVRVL